MPGRLSRNLRQGHKAQRLGIELLGHSCAVAEVPQAEDVGFDAVATLLRHADSFLFAEDTFLVQFKAKSVRKITYHTNEYRWLRGLTLPLFIASIDLRQREIELFTTHVVSSIDADAYESAVLYLDAHDSKPDGGVLHQSLGPPILRWKAAQSEKPSVRKVNYDVLKAWNSIEARNLRHRTIRESAWYKWQTNEIPKYSFSTMMGSLPAALAADIATAAPFIQKLGLHFVLDEKLSVERIALYVLCKWMAKEANISDFVFTRLFEERFLTKECKISLNVKVEKNP